jgi:DNA-binding CsgD family transcriptional regulator
MNCQGSFALAGAVDRRFSHALDAIGQAPFARQLLAYLNEAVRAEHCVLYRFGEEDLEVLGAASVDGTELAGVNSERYRRSFWRRDAVFAGLQNRICGYASEVACVPAEEIADPKFRQELFFSQGLSGRAMLVGDRGTGLYGVSLFRRSTLGFFSEAESSTIVALADILVSCVAKHCMVVRDSRQTADSSFASIEGIERRILEIAPTLTNRERQVCARLVFGLEVKEIAKDLEISPESAVTYRKRAYLRLDIETRAELLRCLLQRS